MDRQPKETMQQYRGRKKREMNAANDALGLKEGEPISYAGRGIRYRKGIFDKFRPSQAERLAGHDLAEFLAKEAADKAQQERWKAEEQRRAEFMAQPHAKAARTLQWAMETDMEATINRIPAEDWIAMAAKLEAQRG